MYKLLKFLRKVLLKLPLSFSIFLGKLIGICLYLNNKKRRTAFKNIKIAFPQKGRREIRKILKKSFENIGLSIIETLIFPRITNYIKIIKKEDFEREGGIFVGIHEGSWEIYNATLAKNYRHAILVKEQKKKKMNKFINELRKEEGLKPSISLKELISFLKKGYIVGLVVDHGAKKESIEIDFFSRLVPTPRGAVFLAKKFHKKIYPCFGYRIKDFYHIIEIGRSIHPEGEEKLILREINGVFEDYLKKYPSEYLWTFKRFKYKKDLDVVILSDGKIGHLKQSKALLSFLCEEQPNIRNKVIEVKYKNKLFKNLASLVALLAGKGCIGCGECFDFFFEKDTLRELEGVYADIVISTGTTMAAANKLLASYLGAKSVTILRSNIPLSKFDLNIIPEHDRVEGKNVIKIKGALFYPYNLEKKVKECKEFFNLKEDKRISLFLGGPLRDKKEFIDNLKIFVERIKSFSVNKGYRLLISTSRRTPKDVEEYLKKELQCFKNTEVIIYASKNNYDFVFDSFVLLSEMVFVSSESISMVSEIASLKKPCISVFLERSEGKYEVFLQSMENDIVLLKYPYSLENLTLKTSNIFEENRKIIKEAIKKLF
jgi:lauroyl/myristoyl acyltransferase